MKEKYNYEEFILWGRSMGAATALGFYEDYIYSKPGGDQFAGVKALVLDSPFTDFRQVILNKINNYLLINWFKDGIMRRLEEAAEKNHNIRISDIHMFKDDYEILNEIPILLIASAEDELTSYDMIEKLSQRFKGEHRLITLKGKHAASREPAVLETIYEYVIKMFGKPVKTLEARLEEVDANEN